MLRVKARGCVRLDCVLVMLDGNATKTNEKKRGKRAK